MFLEESAELEGYALIDSGNNQRLERFGDFVLARPDPAILWKPSLPENVWLQADATFLRKSEEKGMWSLRTEVPDKWMLGYTYKGITVSFSAKLTPFKHTGIFPEQVSNWNFIIDQAQSMGLASQGPLSDKTTKKPKLLNLFGYTGIASVVAAKAGFDVTHVDSSKPTLEWARENMQTSNLPDDAIRWILDDCIKFVKREERRGVSYDAIILDPPAFGRGAKGEVWKFNEQLPELLDALTHICSENFKFLIINSYAVSVSAILLKNVLADFMIAANLGKRNIEYGELVIQQQIQNSTDVGRVLSTGIFGRLY